MYFGLLMPNELVMSSKNDDFKVCHILNTVVINYFQSFSQVDLYVLSVVWDLKYWTYWVPMNLLEDKLFWIYSLYY